MAASDATSELLEGWDVAKIGPENGDNPLAALFREALLAIAKEFLGGRRGEEKNGGEFEGLAFVPELLGGSVDGWMLEALDELLMIAGEPLGASNAA